MKAHPILQKYGDYSKAISETFKTAQTYMRARNVRPNIVFVYGLIYLFVVGLFIHVLYYILFFFFVLWFFRMNAVL